MRVVYCIAGLWQSGGTERVVTTKMNWLATKGGCEVHVVMHDGHREEFFPLSAAVRRHYVAEGAPLRVYRRELTALLTELRADVVICTGGSELPFLWKIADGSKKILEFHYTRNFLVNFVRGIRHIRFRRLHLLKVWLMQKRIAHFARRYDRMVGLTERDVHLWGDPANMTYIYNPLSFRSERKSTTENREIIAVGSFTPAKGMDQLVEAFKSTLDETVHADILLHVVDASSPAKDDQIVEVNKVLEEIDAHEIPTILVLNKIDQTDLEPEILRNSAGEIEAVRISALNGVGLDLRRSASLEKARQIKEENKSLPREPEDWEIGLS